MIENGRTPRRPRQSPLSLSTSVAAALPPTHHCVHVAAFCPERGSVIEKAESGPPVSESLGVCEAQATSSIHALQTAASFRHTFKSKVSSSHYTACTHYAALYIDPSLVCSTRTSLCISATTYLDRLGRFLSNASHRALTRTSGKTGQLLEGLFFESARIDLWFKLELTELCDGRD